MLRIAVCVKQVPANKITVSGNDGNLLRTQMKGCMNMYDYAALETALRVSGQACGCVDVFTMGPESSVEALREALSYGADRAFLLSDHAFAGADVLATAYTISCAINKAGPYDLVVCGLKTTDGDTAQVGGELAANLHITYVPGVCAVKEVKAKSLQVEMLTDEQRITLKTEFPVLMSVEPSACVVRIPTLTQRLKGRKKEIKVWNAWDIEADRNKTGMSGSATKVVKLLSVDRKGKKGMPRQLSSGETVSLIEERIKSWIKTS